MGKIDRLQVVIMFTVLFDMPCNSNLWFYLRASWCFKESAGSLPPVTSLNGHNIRPTSCLPSGRFRVSTETSQVVVPGMYKIHYKHNPLVSSSVFNNNLNLLIYESMWNGTYACTHT